MLDRDKVNRSSQCPKCKDGVTFEVVSVAREGFGATTLTLAVVL